MSSIGETFVSSFTASHHCKGAINNNELADDAGIVSVINVNNLPQSNDNVFFYYNKNLMHFCKN